MREVITPAPDAVVKMTVRIPRKLAVQLAAAAGAANRSLNNMIVTACAEHVSHYFPQE